MTGGHCAKGPNCHFAHGPDELRKREDVSEGCRVRELGADYGYFFGDENLFVIVLGFRNNIRNPFDYS